MITISFTEYTTLGYTLITKESFKRYIAKAILTAVRFTFERLTDKNITEHNKRGICEIAELFYSDDKQINKPLSGFTNNNYSESYGLSSAEQAKTIEDRAYSIMQIYFTCEQLYRGA